MKKKIIIIISILLAIILLAIIAVRFCVNYFFDEYLLETALSSIVDEQQMQEEANHETEETITDPDNIEGNKFTCSEEENNDERINPEEQEDASQEKPKKKLSKTEIISRVMKSQKLTNIMAAMVPYEEKRIVIKIVLSNFSESELNEIAKNVSKGLTPEYKSKMISLAKSRLTGAQWQKCLDIAYKYAEAMRPYVE